MHPKKYFALLLLLILTTAFLTGQAQSNLPDVSINWQQKLVVIRNTNISKQSTMADIRKVLGAESRSLHEEGNPVRSYIYDSLGINFIVDTVAGSLRKIDLYCAKGRREFETSPAKLFTGRFLVNEALINFTDSVEAIREKTKLDWEEMGAGFYWYTVDNEEFSLTITYASKRKERISKIYILLDAVDE